MKPTEAGQTWALNMPLWRDPRRQQWFGGGYDSAGIHSLRFPVDGKLVVTRTDDGGKAFQAFGQGLPQTHAFF